MLICGNCLFTSLTEKDQIRKTAEALKGLVTHFRVKVYGGGTNLKKYYEGVGKKGLYVLEWINEKKCLVVLSPIFLNI